MTLCNSDDHLNGNDNEDKCDANSSNNELEYTVLESPTWIGFAVFKTILMIIGLFILHSWLRMLTIELNLMLI